MMQRTVFTALRRQAVGSSAQQATVVARRSMHWSMARAAASPNDASTGVDPGYDANTKPSDKKEYDAPYHPSTASDPYPLPFDPRLQGLSMASEHQNEGLINGVEEPIPLRVPGREPGDESRETKVARLIYQARKRGTLEADLLLATFAKKELKQLGDAELEEFDRLLDEPDWDIFYWMTDRKPVVERWKESFATEGRLGWRLRKHARNEERETRFMPTL